MRKALVIAWTVFFVVCITAKDITAVAWDIWYVANKSYVAKELCENKAKPAMHCDGKCYLAKQLKKAEEPAPQEKAPYRTLRPKTAHYWIPGEVRLISVEMTVLADTASSTLDWPDATGTLSTFHGTIFHPPAQEPAIAVS